MRWGAVWMMGLMACHGSVDVSHVDADGDGFPGAQDCDDADASVYPGAEERCDGVDQDCDGVVDDHPVDGMALWVDGDLDGYGDATQPTTACEPGPGQVLDATDCDDHRADIHPNAEERCDGLDNDCDSEVDEDGVDGTTWFADADGDGFGDASATRVACTLPEGYVAKAGDCDDADPDAWPGAPERCDGVDSDCAGNPWLEEDADGDGRPNCAEALWVNTDPTTTSSPQNKGAGGGAEAAALLEARGVSSSLLWTYRSELSRSQLDRVGVVVLFGQGDFPLDRGERERLLSWVEDGGGLLVVTGWGAESSCPNAELEGLGLTCEGPGEEWSGSATPVSAHPVTDGVEEVCVQGADPWTVHAPAEVVVEGERPAVVVVERGAGRVVLLADESPLYNEGTGECDLSWVDHAELVDDIWAWLTDFDL